MFLLWWLGVAGSDMRRDHIPEKYKHMYIFKVYDPENDGENKRNMYFDHNYHTVYLTREVSVNDNDLIFKYEDLKRIDGDKNLRHFIREYTKPLNDLSFFANKLQELLSS